MWAEEATDKEAKIGRYVGWLLAGGWLDEVRDDWASQQNFGKRLRQFLVLIQTSCTS